MRGCAVNQESPPSDMSSSLSGGLSGAARRKARIGSIQYPRGSLGAIPSSAGLDRLAQDSHTFRTAADRARSRTLTGAIMRRSSTSPRSVMKVKAEIERHPMSRVASNIAPVVPAT
eukprot:5440526-Pyramimonas_sp.AAC.1